MGNSIVKTLLNDGDTSYLKTIERNDSTSYGYIDLEHVWNIGGTKEWSELTRSDFYTAERSETKSPVMTSHLWEGAIGLMYPSDYGYATNSTNSICDSEVMYNWNYNKNEIANEECAQKSWLLGDDSQWTLTPPNNSSGTVLSVDGAGRVVHGYVYGANKVRPVLFLKPNTKIVGGIGTDQHPFVLGT